jgi:hypothetical protein
MRKSSPIGPLRVKLRHVVASVANVFRRAVSAVQTPSQRNKAVFKLLARRWVFVDGTGVDGPFLSSSGQWVVIVHNRWWAARPADASDRRLVQSPHKIIEPLLIKLSSHWTDQASAGSSPMHRVAFDKGKLAAWAEAGSLRRCRICGVFCEDPEDPSDEYRQAAYLSIARMFPWGMRVNRDVLSALLSTAPEGVKFLWCSMTPVPNTSGAAAVTFISPDSKWCGQMLTHVMRCDKIHPVESDCKNCNITDAEMWRQAGEGLC